ncbi:MAG TPA: protein-disulfide reductase DsbD domain-containing protein [Terriglobales bacterium]|nr:protein-disulfide reductase DsbD domain-containing protein [Terriglobales bacterium]
MSIRPAKRAVRFAARAGRGPLGLGLALALLAAAAFARSAAVGRAAQDDQVVEAKVLLSRDGVHPGETVKVAVVLRIRPGYHINNDMPADQFLVPTTLAIDESQGAQTLEVVYPQGHRGRFAYTQAELIVYEGEAVLGALVRLEKSLLAGPLTMRGTVSYQACDNASCLPPKDLRFEFEVPVVEAGRKTHDVHADVFGKIAFSDKVK